MPISPGRIGPGTTCKPKNRTGHCPARFFYREVDTKSGVKTGGSPGYVVDGLNGKMLMGELFQYDMDAVQYKKYAGHPGLPVSTYKLSCHLPDGRAAYSFCVCPGGEVVAAASEENRVVTNGMETLVCPVFLNSLSRMF